MIEAIDLTVRRRGRTLLDAVSFDVRPGQVTGVLGGTGAGKTVLLRRMVELERGRGETLFDGRPYRALRHPMREVGLLLDPAAGDPDRTVRGHLRLALSTDRGAARVGALAGVPQPSAESAIARRYGFEGRSVSAREQRPTGRRVGADRAVRVEGIDADASGAAEFDRDCDAEFDQHRDHEREQTQSECDASEFADRIEAARRGRAADRIDAVLDIVGLADQRRTRLSDLTEGMATRLGIAVALLGDPKALLLDCPDRGLEPEGVAWLGQLLRAFTAQGRAALVTGADTETLIAMVDRVLLLDSGYLVGTRTAEEVLRAPTGASVVVRSPQIVRFAAILGEAGARSTQGEGACLEVRGLDRARVGDLAFRHGIPVHELSDRFTGSDPADLVLAACTGRRARPVVPIQGFPDGKHVVGVPTAVTVTTDVSQPGVRTWGAKTLRPVRWSETTGGPVSNVRVMNVQATPERAASETAAASVADRAEERSEDAARDAAIVLAASAAPKQGPVTDAGSADDSPSEAVVLSGVVVSSGVAVSPDAVSSPDSARSSDPVSPPDAVVSSGGLVSPDSVVSSDALLSPDLVQSTDTVSSLGTVLSPDAVLSPDSARSSGSVESSDSISPSDSVAAEEAH